MFRELTRSHQVLVRKGFSDCDTFGTGYAFAATGNLDAPSYIPQGSVRLHNTMKPNPQQSLAHRDHYAGCKPIGAGHDGPEAVPPTLYLHTEE